MHDRQPHTLLLSLLLLLLLLLLLGLHLAGSRRGAVGRIRGRGGRALAGVTTAVGVVSELEAARVALDRRTEALGALGPLVAHAGLVEKERERGGKSIGRGDLCRWTNTRMSGHGDNNTRGDGGHVGETLYRAQVSAVAACVRTGPFLYARTNADCDRCFLPPRVQTTCLTI
ncbi:hypothetical protein JG687_00009278 [Phytophthora cactorum]|uniref:Secreted protein n=1 Tax=Phytophthora cactorum TaxID=29920 RepID=A0A8T1UFG6_9STRA|nr:hypothetical protein JG687_00009278 [Phytophthora cactorum]